MHKLESYRDRGGQIVAVAIAIYDYTPPWFDGRYLCLLTSDRGKFSARNGHSIQC